MFGNKYLLIKMIPALIKHDRSIARKNVYILRYLLKQKFALLMVPKQALRLKSANSNL